MKKVNSGLLLLGLFFFSRCTKSGASDPVKHDTSYVDLLSSVSFYRPSFNYPDGKFLMDSFNYNQSGMIANLLLYDAGGNPPLETYTFQIDSINLRILSFEYSILANNANQYTKFDIRYNQQGMVSAMIPEAGGSMTAQDFQVNFTYNGDKVMNNPFGVTNLTDTLVYDQENLIHRQHYGGNSGTHVSIPATEQYFRSSYPNPFYNAALANSAALFMKIPADDAGREFDYIADTRSKYLPDSVYSLQGDNTFKIQWGMHYYTWTTDTEGRVTGGNLVMQDSVRNGMTGMSVPVTFQYRFMFAYKKQMIVK